MYSSSLVTNTPQDSCRLAMIDDNPMEHLIFKKLCERHQLFSNAAHFSDARMMLNLLTQEDDTEVCTPDVILLDLQMPEFNGWDFLQHLESVYTQFKKPVYVYVFSSSIDPADKARSSSYSFVTDFISKPMRPEILRMMYDKHANVA